MPIHLRYFAAFGLLLGASTLQASPLCRWYGPPGLDLISASLIMALLLIVGVLLEAFTWQRKPSGVASPLTLTLWTPVLLVFFVVGVWLMFDGLRSGEMRYMSGGRHSHHSYGHDGIVRLRSSPGDFWISFFWYALLVSACEAGVIRCLKAWARLWKQWRRHRT
jgi:hypothetical protein